MKKLIIIAAVLAVVVGLGAGILGAQAYYRPKVNTLTGQVADLNTQVTALTDANNTLTGEKSQLTNELEAQGEVLVATEAQRKQLAADLNLANQDITNYKTQVTALLSNVAALNTQLSSAQTQTATAQKALNDTLSINVIQHYDWSTYTWELTIPMSLYMDYKERQRPSPASTWVNMAKDPDDTAYINQMIVYINTQALKYGFSDTQKLNFVVAFVQSLPYTSDSVTTGADEYPRYPIETLFDRGGDCEDTSILTAAILNRMGYDVALLELPGHMAVGIALSNGSGYYYTQNGKKYYYLETTGDGWKIGEMPVEYRAASAHVYPLK